MFACVCACAFVYVCCMCMLVCTHVHLHMHMACICVHVCICANGHVCVRYICSCVCICVNIYYFFMFTYRFVSGVITRDKISNFERVMWRACHGNVFFKYADIVDLLEDPTSGEMIYKCVFHVFFQGEQLKNKVKKICEAYV